MDAKLKKAKDLKNGDTFAMKSNEISFLDAKVISIKSKDEYEVEINYEFELFGKMYNRRDLLPKKSYVLLVKV